MFKDVSAIDIMNTTTLDPHFSQAGMSPIARFEPSTRGWSWALQFAANV